MLKIYFSLIVFSILFLQSNSLSFQDLIIRKINEINKFNNTMISPLSIYQYLSLLSNGAVGDTQKELLQVLLSENELEDKTSNLIAKINSNNIEIISNIKSEYLEDDSQKSISENSKLRFNDVNGIFVRKDLKLAKQFTEISDKYNTSYFQELNVKIINEFCRNNTNGKIDGVVDFIPPYAKLVLANALYFKGEWVEKFSKGRIKKRNFLNSDNTTALVDTMDALYTSKYYYEDENVQIISLPYISNKLDFHMIIILPNLNKYSSPLDYLTKENISLSDISSKLKIKRNIRLYLPKFKYEFRILLSSILKDLGLKGLFEESHLNNIFENGNVGIEEILHATYIDVNENGTEAAAVTVNVFNGTIMRPKEELVMNVNHSFIYMIQSNKITDSDGNYLIPFVGIINQLEEEIEDEKQNDNNLSNDASRDSNIEKSNDSNIGSSRERNN